MTLAKGLLFTGFALTVVMGFQNCGKVALSANDNNDVPNLSFSGKFEIIKPQNESSTPPRQLDRTEALPVALEFGHEYKICELCLNNPYIIERPFVLDIASGLVRRKSNNTAVYQLTQQEHSELRDIFKDSVAINYADLLGGGLVACTMDYSYGYATLITDKEQIDLGTGSSSCPFDLYKTTTKRSAGLREFVARLTAGL